MYKQLFEDLALPVQGQVYSAAHSATAARYKIPPSWRGQMVAFTSDGSRLRVLFGDETVAIDDAEVAVSASETIAANWGSGSIVGSGCTREWPVPTVEDRPDVTHFAVDSSDTIGYWSAEVSSGAPAPGEQPNLRKLGKPLLHLDAGVRACVDVDSGAVTVATMRCRENNYVFTGSAKPDLFTAVAASSGMLRPAISFVAGSSERLQSTDATLAAALGGANPFTLLIAFRRTATGAAHCLFSVGTTGSNNGRWDVTIDASDDVVITRVDSAGNSTTSTYATTVTAAMHTLLITFDGTTPLAWLDGTSIALTGTAAGNVGTTTKVTVGARAYNTSTEGNYASAEVSRVLVFSAALASTELAEVQAFARRVAGV